MLKSEQERSPKYRLFVWEASQFCIKAIASLHWKLAGNLGEDTGWSCSDLTEQVQHAFSMTVYECVVGSHTGTVAFRYQTVALPIDQRKKVLPPPFTVPAGLVQGKYVGDSASFLRALDCTPGNNEACCFYPADRCAQIEQADEHWNKALYAYTNLLTWKSPALVSMFMKTRMQALCRSFGPFARLILWLVSIHSVPRPAILSHRSDVHSSRSL